MEANMTQDYWKWPESDWFSEDADRKKADAVTVGIDLGTTSSQAVVMRDGRLLAYANIRTGPDYKKTAAAVTERAMKPLGLGLDDCAGIAATGWGSANALAADKTVDEIHCHALGARYIYGPAATTVVDLGGQTCKAIRLYEWDRTRDFMLNDKCATGMGRNIELMSEILRIPITEIGEKSLDVEKDPEPVSTTCYNFANPETMGLFRPAFREDRYGENEVLAAYLFAIAWRIVGVIGKLQSLDAGDFKVDGALAFTGGLAKNRGITARIERELGVKALSCEYDPQLAGAVGAALLA
jgi:predicted CoA-substrate-specific enzyme activase